MEKYRDNSKKQRTFPFMGKSLSWRKYDSSEIVSLTKGEKRQMLIKSFLVVVLLDYFFYREPAAVFFLGGIGIYFYCLQKKELQRKKREEARDQFKELLVLVSTVLKAGYSPENAFLSAYGDMKNLYGEESSVCRMLHLLKTGRENNVDFSELWKRIGRKTQIQEIMEFAGVYRISQQKSGNVSSVMDKTVEIIIQRIETEKEIAVLLSARRLEQKIMNVTPFLIMLYIDLTSPGYFDGLYHSLPGVLVMSLCLGIYLGAYLLSVKFVSINV